MGIEYLIQYRPADQNGWRHFMERLDNHLTGGWPAFDVQLTSRGVFFTDNGRSSAAAIAFRSIVDEALSHGHAVTIAEL
jgi:hypothetical protein